jgi:ankyrin repeat protein
LRWICLNSNFNYYQTFVGRTALHWAAFNGKKQLIELILKLGGDPLARDHLGCTPLHWAAGRGNLEAAEVLFHESPSAANMKSKCGNTPALLAQQNHSPKVFQLLAQKPPSSAFSVSNNTNKVYLKESQ